MKVILPGPLGQITQGYMVQLLSQLTRLLGPVVTTDEAVHRIILRAPDGSSWNVTVDAAGLLSTTQNSGKPP